MRQRSTNTLRLSANIVISKFPHAAFEDIDYAALVERESGSRFTRECNRCRQ